MIKTIPSEHPIVRKGSRLGSKTDYNASTLDVCCIGESFLTSEQNVLLLIILITFSLGSVSTCIIQDDACMYMYYIL